MKKTVIYLCLALSVLLILAGCSKKEQTKPDAEQPGATAVATSPSTPEAAQTEEPASLTLEPIEGVWEGAINIPNQPLPIIVKFAEDGGTISIPAQGLIDYPLTSVKLTDSGLFFDMNIQTQHITFDGKAEQDSITGTFKQNGQTYPFELTKGSGEEEGERNMVQTDIKDGTMLGQLELPQGEGPFPLMIIIAGSGPTDRNGNSPLMAGKNNSLKMLAEQLAAEGVASIRYDKRGVGENTGLAGKEEDTRFDDFVADAAAWVKFVKNDGRFSSVGIIGHSEGSLVGMAAAAQEGADSFISLAGAGRTIDQVLLEQLEAQLPAELLQESKDILEQLKQGKQIQDVSSELQALFRASVQPYLISWMKYNPAELLNKLSAPALIVNGNRDLQVPVKDAELLHDAREDAKLLIVDKMNHVLKEVTDSQEDNMAAYSNPDLPLADGLVDGIVRFMVEAGLLLK